MTARDYCDLYGHNYDGQACGCCGDEVRDA